MAPSLANEVGNAGLPIIFQVENELLTSSHTTFGADNVADPSGVYLEDESMKVDTNKRAFDEESNDLHIPSKKPAVRLSSDGLIADIDPALISSPLTEAMVIDATDEETGEREPDNQPALGSFKQNAGTGTHYLYHCFLSFSGSEQPCYYGSAK